MTKREKYNVKLVNDKTFGKFFDFRKDIPEGCDVVIVCVNDGTGLKPKKLLLPHQVYLRDINKLLKEAGGCYKQVTVVSARSKDYIDLLKR